MQSLLAQLDVACKLENGAGWFPKKLRTALSENEIYVATTVTPQKCTLKALRGATASDFELIATPRNTGGVEVFLMSKVFGWFVLKFPLPPFLSLSPLCGANFKTKHALNL